MGDKKLNRLGDEQFEGVAGGYLFDAYQLETNEGGRLTPAWKLEKPYEVIDDHGDVVARFEYKTDATAYAKAHGYSTDWLTWTKLQKLRETGSIN